MGIDRKLPVVSLALLAVGGVAFADDAPPAPKYTGPSIADIIQGSGLTATGYVSGTYSFQSYSASGEAAPKDTNSFILQQAAFTLADQPTAGFGALVNVIAGQNIYTPNYGVAGASNKATEFQLAQAYVQYIGGPVTVIAGKFVTLAGAEVLASVGNTNITRSLLYSFEPVTHTGVRLTYALNDQINLIVGANNGWIYSDEVSAGTGKTLEAGVAWTPSKTFTWSLQGYTGEDTNFVGTTSHHSLIDTAATWNVNSALSLVGSVDWGQVDRHPFGLAAGTPGSADWYGVAGYINYALSDTWRVSGRAEYFDDRKGYLTSVGPDVGNRLYEGTLDFGYAPVKSVELRLEARYDQYNTSTTDVKVKVTQGWLEALYKF
ncbi:MAG TPA: outer membrane beta-barrel protein [Steroidobacteraceae bacterium]|nr:outer membrane beta-barrel protein [Steroidobacteraceae bacterium]